MLMEIKDFSQQNASENVQMFKSQYAEFKTCFICAGMVKCCVINFAIAIVKNDCKGRNSGGGGKKQTKNN